MDLRRSSDDQHVEGIKRSPFVSRPWPRDPIGWYFLPRGNRAFPWDFDPIGWYCLTPWEPRVPMGFRSDWLVLSTSWKPRASIGDFRTNPPHDRVTGFDGLGNITRP